MCSLIAANYCTSTEMRATANPLECIDLCAGYGSRAVLKDINISLSAGSLTLLLGANGSGKSTLLKTLAGRLKPVSGTLLLCGHDISSMTTRELASLRTIVDTSRQGGGALTVSEVVAIGRSRFSGWLGRLSAADKAAVAEAIQAVGMTDYAGRYLGTLSDGEKQKVMIARALAQDTPLILLDEPTAFLDVAARISVMNLLRRLADEGRCIVMSTHDIAPAMTCADNVIAVNPVENTVCFGSRMEIESSGVLDAAFPDANLHYDRNIRDFR